ncbi:MAG: NAD(P)H-binding protein, partial [Gracilimonas sp.]
MNRTAIVIGATGLVGSQVLDQLLEDKSYQKVKVFHRRSTGVVHPKLEEHIVDFKELDSWKSLIAGDELYSALGTTIKKAGGQEAQYTIDFTYQYETAKAAAENGVKKFALVSSAGANPKSRAFYTKLKGELDEAVKELPFEVTVILRPSILAGNR